MLKIAFLIDEFPCISNTFILNQIVGLIDRGHDVDIFSRRVGNLKTVHADIRKHNLLDKMRHIYIPNNYILRYLKAAFLLTRPYAWNRITLNTVNIMKYGVRAGSLTEFYTALSFLREKPYDVVHCQFGRLGVAALPLLQHGVITGKLITSFRGADVTKSLSLKPDIYHSLFKEGHLFLPVSHLFKSKLIEAGCEESKVVVHHSGIDCERFIYANRCRGRNEETKILFIGRLTEKKGVEYAIDAVTRISSLGRKVSFTIIGDGPLRSELECCIKRQGVEDSIFILGSKPQEVIIDYLHNSHILIAPCVTAVDNDQEGIPNVIKEAMATGMPVISTIHSGIPELVEDGISGFLVPERDVDALAERLAYLIDHPELWVMMGRAGRNKVESEFNINKLNDELISLYQVLLN